MVRVFDDDKVEAANLGRQLFSTAELGLYKSVALVNRINLFFGTNWKAIPEKYCEETLKDQPDYWQAELTISCVDTVSARFEIADVLSKINQRRGNPTITRCTGWILVTAGTPGRLYCPR